MGGEGKFILHASIPLVAVSGITFKHMKTLLLFFIFSFSILAGDTVTTVNRPQYLGGGSVSTVKSNGAVSAKIVTTKQPSYLGGGSVSKITPVKK